MTDDAVGTTFTVVQDRWRVNGPDGDITLVFEEIEGGAIFEGAARGTYVGYPDISFDEAGSLIVRSNGDPGTLYDVQAIETEPRTLTIVFTATDFTAAGSVPVEADPEDGKCPICFEEYTPGERLAETPCKHRFHLRCLRRVEGRKCPLCRASL